VAKCPNRSSGFLYEFEVTTDKTYFTLNWGLNWPIERMNYSLAQKVRFEELEYFQFSLHHSWTNPEAADLMTGLLDEQITNNFATIMPSVHNTLSSLGRWQYMLLSPFIHMANDCSGSPGAQNAIVHSVQQL